MIILITFVCAFLYLVFNIIARNYNYMYNVSYVFLALFVLGVIASIVLFILFLKTLSLSKKIEECNKINEEIENSLLMHFQNNETGAEINNSPYSCAMSSSFIKNEDKKRKLEKKLKVLAPVQWLLTFKN